MTSLDRQLEEGAQELPDWQSSIAESGSLRVLGGSRVSGIILLGENQ